MLRFLVYEERHFAKAGVFFTWNSSWEPQVLGSPDTVFKNYVYIYLLKYIENQGATGVKKSRILSGLALWLFIMYVFDIFFVLCYNNNIIKIIKFLEKRCVIVKTKLITDKEIAIEAIKKSCGYVLEYASDDLKKDRDVVLEAVKKNGGALQYASNDLKKDREVVLEAIKNAERSLRYASPKLKNDKNFILEIIRKSKSDKIFSYIPENLQNDKDILLEKRVNAVIERISLCDNFT